MSKSFEIEFREDHVYVVLGEKYVVSPEQENEFWTAVESECRTHNSARVLVEGHAPEREMGPKEVINSGVKASVVPRLWFALSLKNFEPTELSELFKTVAASRGVHVKFFHDSVSALTWLRNNSPA